MTAQFTAIKYTTAYGENCIATKNNGVVTIQGDKNGVRQMPLDEFMKVFVKDQQKISLERSPKTDKVEFTSRNDTSEISDTDINNFAQKVDESKRKWYDMTGKHTINGMGIDVSVKEKLNGRKVEGEIREKKVDLKFYNPGLLDFLSLNKGGLKGQIDGQEINIKFAGTKNGLLIQGLPESCEDIKMHLALLIAEKIRDDVATDNAMAAGAIMSGKV